MSDSGPVVVAGVDGSTYSKEALAWAADQAARTQGRLEVVMCWRQPVNPGFAVDYCDVDFEKEAGRHLDAVLSEVLGETPAAPRLQPLPERAAVTDILAGAEAAR